MKDLPTTEATPLLSLNDVGVVKKAIKGRRPERLRELWASVSVLELSGGELVVLVADKDCLRGESG